jgi:hypothetical protein
MIERTQRVLPTTHHSTPPLAPCNQAKTLAAPPPAQQIFSQAWLIATLTLPKRSVCVPKCMALRSW